MARTAQEVYSLFGLKSPAEVRAEREQQYAEMLQGQSGAGRAGAGIGSLLGGMFRGEDPEAQRYRDFELLTQGQNLNDPEQLRAMAEGLSNVEGWGAQAQAMRMLADTIEKEQMGDIVNAPVQVGTKPIYKQEFNEAGLPTGKYIEVGREPIFKDVPHTRTTEGLVPLLDFNQQTAGEITPPSTPEVSVPDYITNEQGVVVPNPAKTAGASAETVSQESVPAPTQTPSSLANVEANRNIGAEEAALGRGASSEIIDMPVSQTGVVIKKPPTIKPQQEKAGIDAISDDAIISRYRVLKKKRGRKPSEDMLLKKLEVQLLNRGLNEAL